MMKNFPARAMVIAAAILACLHGLIGFFGPKGEDAAMLPGQSVAGLGRNILDTHVATVVSCCFLFFFRPPAVGGVERLAVVVGPDSSAEISFGGAPEREQIG
jgi:hypothetical protein